jgi:hypothetical protein
MDAGSAVTADSSAATAVSFDSSDGGSDGGSGSWGNAEVVQAVLEVQAEAAAHPSENTWMDEWQSAIPALLAHAAAQGANCPVCLEVVGPTSVVLCAGSCGLLAEQAAADHAGSYGAAEIPQGVHSIHLACARQWSSQDSRCPLCMFDWSWGKAFLCSDSLEVLVFRVSVQRQVVLVNNTADAQMAQRLQADFDALQAVPNADMDWESRVQADFRTSQARRAQADFDAVQAASNQVSQVQFDRVPSLPNTTWSTSLAVLDAGFRPEPYFGRSRSTMIIPSSVPEPAPVYGRFRSTSLFALEANIVIAPARASPPAAPLGPTGPLLLTGSSSAVGLSRRMGVQPAPARPAVEPGVAGQAARLASTMVARWVQLALQAGGPLVESLALSHRAQNLEVLFGRTTGSTLRRHLGGWLVWATFAIAAGISQAFPALQEIVDFIQAVVEEVLQGRGLNRGTRAMAIVSSMRFMGSRLQLSILMVHLNSELVGAWLDRATRPGAISRLRREAAPLPLWLAVALEQLFWILAEDAQYVLGVFLLAIWAGLRWSDVQRTRPVEVTLSQGVIRSWCWQTKTSRSGMPFGALATGWLGTGWGERWFELVRARAASDASCDHMISVGSQPASYICALAALRQLCVQAGLPLAEARLVTLHSLKVCFLTWGLQLDAPLSERSSQGHHREAGLRGMATLYGRDDVLPQLRLQIRVLSAAAGGWRPLQSQGRGSEAPLTEAPVRSEIATPPSYSWFMNEVVIPAGGRVVVPAADEEAEVDPHEDTADVLPPQDIDDRYLGLLAAGLLARPPPGW